MPRREGTREVPGLSRRSDTNDCEGTVEVMRNRFERNVAPFCELEVVAVIVWEMTELLGRASPHDTRIMGLKCLVHYTCCAS